ncbi:hypothetical protein [Maribacter aurantiacus]|uniref:Uncharacterized protein n=1 Tax=Maribacter aurantiacus TaxID=1882343 RepID=A0A5R8LSG2_9FLAO|nr:hypothetical protein [Maribacter aurantiacus]TLF40191.1 hypothetical protein FEK29_17455 [Maribacter aurantiacus]
MGCVANPGVLGIGNRKSPKKYSDAIGNGLGDAAQGLIGFQVSQNQPSLFGYFFGDGKSIGKKKPALTVPYKRNAPYFPFLLPKPIFCRIFRVIPLK